MDGHAPPSLALTSSHGATAFQRQLSQADQSHLLSDAAVLGITITFWGTMFTPRCVAIAIPMKELENTAKNILISPRILTELMFRRL
jgi:hypothetical protein